MSECAIILRRWNCKLFIEELTPLTAVIGKNGVGKSTLFDVFGFLSDCLKFGVEEACDMNSRGGFHKMRSQSSNESIDFQIYYKEDYNSRPITYEISIDLDENVRPYVKSERLRQRREGQSSGWPFSFLLLNEGRGAVWKGELEGLKITKDNFETTIENLLENIFKENAQQVESNKTEWVELSDKRKLGIATLGALTEHPRISAFRMFIEKMSDGTLKVFAYLLLLEDPTPPQFLYIEEPEKRRVTNICYNASTVFCRCS